MLKPISMLAKAFGYISDTMAGMVGFGLTLGTIFAFIYRTKLKTLATDIASAYVKRREAGASIVGAIAGIFGGQGKIPIVGAILAATMVGALFSAISKASSAVPTGDMNSPAGGETMVSTKEGGLFKLSKNDDLIAAPGASTALANAANGGGGAGMQAMANVIAANTKAMERLNSGGIPVNTYLGTSKVNDLLTGYQSKTTRNNFNI
jgi:hypothetical protein